jgi:RHS repeat-associated protein
LSGTDVINTYTYTTGATGDLLSYETTSAVTSSGSAPLLGFGSSSTPLAYDNNDNLTSSTPYVSGTAQTSDTYFYDAQQRVTSGPETSGSTTDYSYVNSSGTQPFYSNNTVDQMGIDASPQPGSTPQLGDEYAGNGELCWIAENPSTTTGNCGTPGSSASAYEAYTYNASGERTATTPTGYGTNSALTWDQDAGTLSCINSNGTICTTPSATTTATATYTYNGDGLRMSATTWDSSTSSAETTSYTWDTTNAALLSNGTFDYVYGQDTNVPIAQIDTGDSVTSELLTDTNSDVKGIVEVSTAGANPFILANYTDYDTYGNPITASAGSIDTGGLTGEGETGDPDSASSFGFGGGYEDPTGLVYLLHRYYDPTTGQLISVDPALSQTLQPYDYTDDDPVKGTDPMGLEDVLGDHATCKNVKDGHWSAQLCVQVNTYQICVIWCTNEFSQPQAVWSVTSGTIRNVGATMLNMEVCANTGPYPGYPLSGSCYQNDDAAPNPSATCGGKTCTMNGPWYLSDQVNWEDAWVKGAWLRWQGGPRLKAAVSLHESPLCRLGNGSQYVCDPTWEIY